MAPDRHGGADVRGARVLRTVAPLPQTARSKTQAAMEAQLETLEPGTHRHHTLRTAIDFKRSWLELARALSEVATNNAFKQWGYRTIHAYASHELHLRKDTAEKLLRSYTFLESHEPKWLDARKEAGDAVPLPSYQALDVLAQARENPYLSETDFRDLRDQVFGADPTPAQVRRLVKERVPEPMDNEDNDAKLRKCLALAERLYGLLLESDGVPEELPEALEGVVGGLRRVIDDA